MAYRLMIRQLNQEVQAMSGKKVDNEELQEQTDENEPTFEVSGYDISKTSEGKIILKRFNKQYNLDINLEFETVRTGNTKKLLELLSDAYMEKLQDNIIKDELTEKKTYDLGLGDRGGR